MRTPEQVAQAWRAAGLAARLLAQAGTVVDGEIMLGVGWHVDELTGLAILMGESVRSTPYPGCQWTPRGTLHVVEGRVGAIRVRAQGLSPEVVSP